MKKYIEFDFSKGFPAGDRIRYECCICGGSVASIPKYSAACKCRNIIVDTDAGHVAVKDPAKLKAYEDAGP